MDGSEKKEVRRPMNAFLIFCKRHRGFVREKNPDMDNRSVTRVLGDLWANLGEEKKIYTNLAKQYKDAFMKANPNYKWHSAEKSQSSSGKIVNKPTNSRVIKNVPEIHSDGTIIPGKLADPEKMGGLNLLLMADKETCEGRNTSSSQPSKMQHLWPRTAAVTISSVISAEANANPSDHLAMSNSALLQLAEMCTSELQGSQREKSCPRLNTHSLAGIPSLALNNLTTSCYQSMPPPKKRVRHWSLTESDSTYDAPVDYSMKDNNYGDLSSQNTSSQKNRCLSLGSSACSDDRYSSWEKCNSTTLRRRLSSSATESIPSPTCPDGIDETDLPVFSPDTTKSERIFPGEFKYENHENFVNMQGNFTKSYEPAVNNPALVSGVTVHSSPTNLEESVYQKLLKSSQQPNTVAVSLQLHQTSSNLVAGMSRNASWHDRKEPSELDHQLPDDSYRSSFVSLRGVSSSEGHGDREVNATSERSNNPDFHIWREPGKVTIKTEELSPGSFNFQASSISVTKSSPSPVLRLKSSSIRQVEYNTQQHILAGFGPSCDATSTSAPFPSSVNSRPASTGCSPTGRKSLFTSGVSEGRNAHIFSNSDKQTPSLLLNFSNNSDSAYHFQPKAQADSKDFFKTSVNETAFKINNPITSSQKIPSEVNKTDIISSDLKLLRPEEGSTLRAPFAHQSHTFSEGKLKKKWAERMLEEERSKEDFTEQCNEEFVKTDPFVLGGSTVGTVEANKNTSVNELKPVFSTVDKFITDTTVSLRHPQAGNLKTFSDQNSHSHHGALLILNQSNCPLEPPTRDSNTTAFNSNNHSKLMFNLSQNHQNFKPDPKPQTSSDETIIKLDLNARDITRTKKVFSQDQLPHIDNSKREDIVMDVKSEDLSNKQVLSQIAACGKKFMGRIVEQLYKTDLSLDRQTIEIDGSGNYADIAAQSKKLPTEVRLEQQNRSALTERGLREDAVEWIKKDKKNDNDMVATNNFEDKRKASVTEKPSRKWDIYRQGATSPSDENHSQNHWSAVMPELADQLDINEDSSLQPVRKSRRANRGQKYQELIKEGFIQPSRERLAARNAERHGRSFGSREEFEKMEMKRTLKRSASERDTLSDSMAGYSAAPDSFTDKRFTSGDFDLEKEIESLPVCSLEQLDRKKVMRRRCDSDTIGSPPSHMNKGEDAILSQAPLSIPPAKMSPLSSSVGKHEVDLSEPACPAPHIPLPREGRPIEPVTGSRKRKARKHCITRISVVDEISSTTDMVVQKCVQPLGCPVLQKKACTLSSNNDNIGNKNIPEVTKNLPSLQEVAVIKVEDGKLYTSIEDLKAEGIENKVEPKMSPSHCLEEKADEKIPVQSIGTPLTARSVDSFASTLSSQSFSQLSNMPNLKAAFLIPQSSNKVEYQLELAASMTLKQMQPFEHSPHLQSEAVTNVPALKSVDSSPETIKTIILKSKSPSIEVTSHCSVVLDTESTSKTIQTSSGAYFPVTSKIITPKDKDLFNCPKVNASSIPSSTELLTEKCLEKTTKRTPGRKIKSPISPTDEKPQAAFKKVQMNLKRKLSEKRISVVTENSSKPLVSVLLGHSEPSCAIKHPTREYSITACLQQCLDNEKLSAPLSSEKSSSGACETVMGFHTKTTDNDFCTLGPSSKGGPAFVFKSQLFPHSLDKSVKSPNSSKATPKDSISVSTIKTSIPLSEPVSFTDCLPSETTFKDDPSLLNKPHPTIPEPVVKSSVSEAAHSGPLQPLSMEAAFVLASGSISQLSSHTTSSLMTSEPSSLRTSTCSALHNSILNVIPPSLSSSSSLSSLTICTSSSTYVSATSPLLSLTPPLSSPCSSSTVLSPPTVISLAASTPSTKSDIVSYTVIGSSSIMETGSPHMIASPHLPESPSVAIVQS